MIITIIITLVKIMITIMTIKLTTIAIINKR